MDPTQQTLAVGLTSSQKFGRLGGFEGRAKLPPHKLVAYVTGFPNCGKSAMLQEIPDSYLLNMDLSSTTALKPRCVTFPGYDAKTNRSIDEQGRPIVLTYADILKRVDLLRDMATKNEPRPATVVFDSLTAMIRLACDHCIVNAQQIGLARDACSHWEQLNGKAAWGWVHDSILDTICTMRDAGYGVFVSGHFTNARQQIGDNQYVVKPESMVTDGFWKKLSNVFELVAYVFTEKKRVSTPRELKSVVNGKELIERRMEVKDVDAFYITVTRSPDLQNITKSRTDRPLPDRIELPQPGAWDTFAAEYIKSNQ